MIDRVLDWLRRCNARELPCGCLAMDGKPAIHSEEVTEIESRLETTREKAYTNCTKRWSEIVYDLQCDECGASWTESRSASVGYDFGSENPEADQRLVPTGRHPKVGRSFEEEPVVDRGRGR